MVGVSVFRCWRTRGRGLEPFFARSRVPSSPWQAGENLYLTPSCLVNSTRQGQDPGDQMHGAADPFIPLVTMGGDANKGLRLRLRVRLTHRPTPPMFFRPGKGSGTSFRLACPSIKKLVGRKSYQTRPSCWYSAAHRTPTYRDAGLGAADL